MLETEFQSIKIPLKSILLNYNINFEKINNLAIELNKHVIDVTNFLKLYYLKTEKIILNQDFIYQIFIILTNNKTKNSELNNFYTNVFQPIYNHVQFDSKLKHQIYQYLSIEILTNIKVNIQERFFQHLNRFKNFISTKLPIHNDSKINKKYFNISYNKILINDSKLNEFDILNKNTLIKYNILPQEFKKNYYYDLKANPIKYLKGILNINKFLEKHELKVFNILPIRNSLIPKFFTIDSITLKTIFKLDNWNEFLNFRYRLLKEKNKFFNNIIRTDGVSCILLFKKKKIFNKVNDKLIENLNDQELENLKSKTLIGCDPGKKNLIFLTDENENTFRYTQYQRRSETYMKKNELLHTKLKKGFVKTELDKLSLCNSKSTKIDIFEKFIKTQHEIYVKIHSNYDKLCFRKMNLRKFIHEKKSIDKMLNNIEDKYGQNIVIGFGNWSSNNNNCNLKNNQPTIGVELKRKIAKRFDTILINEFRTSKLHFKCHQILEKVYDNNNKIKHSLLLCNKCESSQNKNCTFVNRDKNASMNILLLMKNWIFNKNRILAFSKNAH